ncbi:MAG: carbohydrate-binding domain-containing protein [Defluviitaleaceae bacterium]|nr:carbohydrate-binding domain-containing protein [Defluviitaleaceae bacterium]
MKTKIIYIVTTLILALVVFVGCSEESRFEQFPDGVYSITGGGTYTFTGEYRGQIHIDARREDVILVFDNFTLHNPNGAAIFAPRTASVEIILTDGSENTISNRGDNDAININDDLIISGNGTLNVRGEGRHGIRSDDIIIINGGTINVVTEGSALRGRDGVIINDGVITLRSDGDGIRTTLDSDTGRGFVTINGGTIDINTGGDAIESISNVTINGGDIRIRSRDDGIHTGDSIIITGGNLEILESSEGIEGRDVTIEGGNISITAINDGINARYPMVADGEDPGSEPFIRMTGGHVQTNTRRDSIESDGYVFLEGGTLHVSGVTSGRPSGEIIITGGEFISTGNMIRIANQTTQSVISSETIRQQLTDSLIEIKDSDENIILSFSTPNAFSRHAVFSSPNIEYRQTYFIYINGTRTYETVSF